MKNKKSVKILVLFSATLVFLMALAMNASAVATTLTLQEIIWGQDGFVNITFTGAGSPNGTNITELTVFISATDTANSTTSLVFNISNTTATDFMGGSANFTFGTDLVVEDTAVASVTAISTGEMLGDALELSAVTVLIDRTAPTKGTTSSTNGAVFEKDDVISYTVTGTDTVSCTISFGRPGRFTGTNTFAMTHSGDTCTYTVTRGNPGDGTYSVQVQATDGTNNSVSDEKTFQIDVVKSDTTPIGDGLQVGVAQQVAQNRIATILMVLFVVVIFVMLNKKK